MSMAKPTPSRIATWGMKPIWTYVVVLFLATGLEAIGGESGDCYLEAWGTIDTLAVTHCNYPIDNVTLTKTAYFKCKECGSYGPLTDISAVGHGECALINCKPFLIGIDYEVSAMTIAIRNRRFVFPLCQNAGTAVSSKSCVCPFCGPGSPIIISLHNGSLQLTSPEDGVQFDLTADGTPQQTAWTQGDSDDAFLVLDRNGNGLIDNGAELFGDHTPQLVSDPADRNGFEALAVFDDSLNGGNEDGFIDESDEIFSDLQLWTDSNHNGISEASEIRSLSEAGVEAIDLSYRSVSRTDAHGNEFRFATTVEMSRGKKIAWDVFFQQLFPLSASAANRAAGRTPACSAR